MKERILELLRAGKSYTQIVEEVGCSKATISYHATKHELRPKEPRPNHRRYNWVEVQAYFDEIKSVRKTRAHFGMAAHTWDKAVVRGAVQTANYHKKPIETYLVEGRSQTSRGGLKKRLLDEGLLERRCYTEGCGITDSWLGQPIALHLDHRNGKNKDNRLENLRLLCPNCHSQTETYRGRNIQRRKYMTVRFSHVTVDTSAARPEGAEHSYENPFDEWADQLTKTLRATFGNQCFQLVKNKFDGFTELAEEVYNQMMVHLTCEPYGVRLMVSHYDKDTGELKYRGYGPSDPRWFNIYFIPVQAS